MKTKLEHGAEGEAQSLMLSRRVANRSGADFGPDKRQPCERDTRSKGIRSSDTGP